MGSLMEESEMGSFEGQLSKEALFYVNGVRRVLPDGMAHLTLLEYLRGDLLEKLIFNFFVS